MSLKQLKWMNYDHASWLYQIEQFLSWSLSVRSRSQINLPFYLYNNNRFLFYETREIHFLFFFSVFIKSLISKWLLFLILPLLDFTRSSIDNEEPDTTFCYSSAQVPNGAMGFTRRRSSNDNKIHGINKTGLHENKSDQERESTEPTDEDYIVFCFREDGAIHVVKDGETEASDQINRVNQSSTRHVNPRVSN